MRNDKSMFSPNRHLPENDPRYYSFERIRFFCRRGTASAWSNHHKDSIFNKHFLLDNGYPDIPGEGTVFTL